MKGLRNRFERFCYQNRSKGIPNLMLYITIGSAVIYLMSMTDRDFLLNTLFRFDRGLILKGQVWRLFTYVLIADQNGLLFTAISLFCYYSLGRAMENSWGTFRFNLFYLTGVILMDIFCMVLGGEATVYYLNLSLFLGYATLYPNTQFLFLFIIPVRAWIFALVDLGLTLYSVIVSTAAGYFPVSLFPLVALGNYLLFFGKDVLNVIPVSWQINARRLFRRQPKSASPKRTGTIPFPNAGSYQASTASVKAPYTHRCTVCGRTDVSDPELEFRYCSRCSGYRCYCQDHINSHAHIQE